MCLFCQRALDWPPNQESDYLDIRLYFLSKRKITSKCIILSFRSSSAYVYLVSVTNINIIRNMLCLLPTLGWKTLQLGTDITWVLNNIRPLRVTSISCWVLYFFGKKMRMPSMGMAQHLLDLEHPEMRTCLGQ